MQIWKGFQHQKIMGSKIQKSFYGSKYQKHVACSYEYKLLYVDDDFSNPFKPYLSEDTVYNFFNFMIEESKYYSEVMKIKINRNACSD